MERVFRCAMSVVALLLAAVLVAGCGSSGKKSSASTASSSSASGGPTESSAYSTGPARRGGVYRVGWEQSFGFTDDFDPTGEYLGNAWDLYSNLLLRSLIGYKHLPGAAGNELVGDLATAVPQPTDNGLTYTYHLRAGVKFGPPVGRAITAKDVVYALTRLANPKDGGQYGFYFSVIKGWDDFAAGKAKTISGLVTPNDRTLVVHLTKSTGDFNLRMSLPATAPIPVEVAKCFEGKPGDYGRDVVSSGPYMIKGADQVSDSSCGALKQMSGYDGADGTHIILVRNPDYDQATDPYRKNYPNEFRFLVDSNADDIYNQVQAGTLDDEVSSPEPKTIRQYETDPSLRPRLRANVGDRTWYITLNLTQPPFDDLHVRRAMNWILDKQAMRQAWGGPVEGSIATHIVPPVLYGGGLSSYDPYRTPNSAGDVAKAAAEMKQSKYDPGHTGKCTAAACKNVLFIGDTRALDNRMIPIVQADAAKIGITFTVRQINGAYPTIQTTSKNIPINERTGWGKDYADPYTFFGELFSSAAIIPTGNSNYSLVGFTPALNRSKKLGVKGTLTGVPSVDGDIAACQAKLNQARVTCWENLDKKIMTQVVPWVPFLWSNNVFILGPKVTHWTYDQFSDGPAYSSVAVKS